MSVDMSVLEKSSNSTKEKMLAHAMFTKPETCIINDVSKGDFNELGQKIYELIKNEIIKIDGMDNCGRLIVTIM